MLQQHVPDGVDGPEWDGKVFKLDRALYGLKQAGRAWNAKIHATLERLGYQRTVSDACVYVRREGGHYHYIALYVDDLLFVSHSQPEIDRVHWAAVVRVCQYIKGTINLGLLYSPTDPPLGGFGAYSDSDWGACPTTSRSTMGFAFVLAGGAVSWSSRLQSRVAASSTEAEYLGLSHAGKEAIFLSQLLGELGHPLPAPLLLRSDNQGANALARDPQFHDRTRHLRLTEHFVRETVAQGEIDVRYIPTALMVADIFTKSLPLPAFLGHRSSLGLRPLGVLLQHDTLNA
ncbi:hypothetical protein JCM1841_002530 [Sporobolomyces salmonicolor]